MKAAIALVFHGLSYFPFIRHLIVSHRTAVNSNRPKKIEDMHLNLRIIKLRHINPS